MSKLEPTRTYSNHTAIDELKPCPFCGGDAEIYDFKDGRYLVECSNTSCDVYPCTSIHYDKEDAIAAWNRRAED